MKSSLTVFCLVFAPVVCALPEMAFLKGLHVGENTAHIADPKVGENTVHIADPKVEPDTRLLSALVSVGLVLCCLGVIPVPRAYLRHTSQRLAGKLLCPTLHCADDFR